MCDCGYGSGYGCDCGDWRLAIASVGKSDGTVARDPVRRPPTMIATGTATVTATATATALSVLVLMANAFITHTPRGGVYEICM